MIQPNPLIENVLATIGSVMWMILCLPQIIKSYREKSTLGLSPHLMTLWSSSCLFFAVYGIAEGLSVPLIPHIFGLLGLISWGQCMYYGRQYSVLKVAGCIVAIYALAGFMEVTSIFTVLYAREHGTEIPLQVYGYINTALCALGFAPQYHEIYRLREVKGISLLALSCDICGGILSSASLFFRARLDWVALSMYIVVIFLDIGIILLSFILNPIARRRTRETTPVQRTVSRLARIGGVASREVDDIEKSPSLPMTPICTPGGEVPVLDYFAAGPHGHRTWSAAEKKLDRMDQSRESSYPGTPDLVVTHQIDESMAVGRAL